MFSSFKTPVTLVVTFLAGALVSYPLISRAEPQKAAAPVASAPAPAASISPLVWGEHESSVNTYKYFVITHGEFLSICRVTGTAIEFVRTEKLPKKIQMFGS